MTAGVPIPFSKVQLDAVEMALMLRIKELETNQSRDPEFWGPYLADARAALDVLRKTRYPNTYASIGDGA